MSDSQANQSKAFAVTSNVILWGGIIVIAAIAINSDHKLFTIGVGIVVVLSLLVLAGLLITRNEETDNGKPEGDRDDREPEVFADWSDRAKQRKREGKAMIGGTVPSFPTSISTLAPKLREDLADFPTFSPDEITSDDSITEDELVADTLVDDTTGYGVELANALFADGLWIAFELLEMDQSEWSITPWGCEMLFGIEAIMAAGGHPSRSRELSRLRSWSKRVHYAVKPELALDFLNRIDSFMVAVREDPLGRDVNPELLEQTEIAAQRMRDRVALLL